MRKTAKENHFLHTPEYEGGPKALRKFIGENLRYPKEALEQRIEGTVSVRYDIDQHGKVTDAKVLSGLGFGCDEEAVRLVKLLQYQVPKNRGLRVVFHKNLHIHFKLPAPAPATAPPPALPAPEQQVGPAQFQYNYVKSAAVAAKKKPKSKSGAYTITYGG